MKRLGTPFGSAEPQEPYPLPCVNLITLITYLFSLLLFVCLSCHWASPYLRTLADTTLLHGCWLINIRDSVFSFISLYCRTNHFHSCLLSAQIFFTKVFFTPPPLLQQHANKFPKNARLLFIVSLRTPLRKQMEASKKGINQSNTQQFKLYPSLPSLCLPNTVQPLNSLPVSIMPIYPTHFLLVFGNDFRTRNLDFVVCVGFKFLSFFWCRFAR